MTTRKRHNPVPAFNMPPPYDPMKGERPPLQPKGIYPYCAMMQVAALDEHDDYVICRGYDPRVKKFFDYDANDLANKPGVPVAKPYGVRGTMPYSVGQVFPAILPLTRIGQNPGVAATTLGQPVDLDEEVELLSTDAAGPPALPVYVSWMLVDTGVASVRFGELKDAHTPGDISTAYLREWDADTSTFTTNTDEEFEVVDHREIYRGRAKDAYSSPHDSGSYVETIFRHGRWEITWMTPHALKLKGYATGNFSGATVDIDDDAGGMPDIMQPTGAIIVDQDPSSDITVYDVFNWDGYDDDLIIAVWNEDAVTPRWEIQEIECPP